MARWCALRGVFAMCGSDPGSGGLMGGRKHSPVNLMHSGDGTPSFSLGESNGWWERSTYDHVSPVNPMRLIGGTPCFSLRGDDGW